MPQRRQTRQRRPRSIRHQCFIIRHYLKSEHQFCLRASISRTLVLQAPRPSRCGTLITVIAYRGHARATRYGCAFLRYAFQRPGV
jgi:hypothetical protein